MVLPNACRSVNVLVVLTYHKVAATHLSCIKLFEVEDQVEEAGRLGGFVDQVCISDFMTY